MLGELSFDEKTRGHSVRIENDGRLWERYYAFVLPDDKHHRFRVFPTAGTLAPREGAPNVCDETKPYSDAATISVEWDADAAAAEGQSEGGDGLRLLVVGTEAEVWTHRLVARNT